MRLRASFLSRIFSLDSPRVLRGRDISLSKPKITRENFWGEHSQVTLLAIKNVAPNEVFPEHVVYLWIPALYGVIPFVFDEVDIWPVSIALTDADNFITDISFNFTSLIFLVDLAIDAYVQPYPMSLSPFVSNNIFVPLEEVGVQGKKYIVDEWKNAFSKRGRYKRRSRKKHSSLQLNTLKTIEMQESVPTSTQERKGPSFFDLIKPLLMPPPISPDADFIQKGFLPPGKKPFQYQWIGIQKLIKNKSFLLADEMGTGKTVMAILALRVLLRRGEVKRILILSPPTILRVWERHLRDWSLGEVTYILVRGPREQRRLIWRLNFHAFITSYDTFSRDVREGIIPKDLLYFDLVILDEAQYIKNRKSARFRSLQKVKFNRKWALTGTPLENRVEDVKTLFDFLIPDLIPENEKSPSRVREYIRPYTLRRLKKEVLPELPPKIREWIWLEMSPKQRRQYEMLWRQGVAELSELKEQGRVSKLHIFTLISKLKQICNFPQGSLKSPKAEVTKYLVENIVSQGEKVIIFSQFVEEGIAKLAKILEGYNVVQLTGDMNQSQREAAIAAFRRDPNVSVFLISLKTGGVGLTLTEANNIIHFDHWWNPAIMKQAEDRVHRPGQQHQQVMIYELGMEDTIEMRIYKILEEKKMLSNIVIDSLAESVALENLDITVDEWLHKVLQIPVDAAESTPHVLKKHAREVQHEDKKQVVNVQWGDVSLEEIRRRFYLLDPSKFEKLVAKIFSHLGFVEVEHIGRTSDGGVDIIAKRYNKSGAIYALIQCKRYSKNVGVQVARDLAGVLSQQGENYVGYIVTSSDFTTRCKRFVANSGGRIKLINGFELARYVIQFGLDDAF